MGEKGSGKREGIVNGGNRGEFRLEIGRVQVGKGRGLVKKEGMSRGGRIQILHLSKLCNTHENKLNLLYPV